MIPRYEDAVIAHMFSPGEVRRRWARVEIAVLWARGKPGQLSPEMLPTDNQMALWEERTDHEFVAFLSAWRENTPQSDLFDRKALHAGLTSSDVQDTALMLVLAEATTKVLRLIDTLDAAILGQQRRIRGYDQIGRTHGQYSIPRQAEWPLDVLRHQVANCEKALRVASRFTSTGKLSGPAGVRGQLSHAIQVKALASLGLTPVQSTQVIPRDGIARWANELATVVTVCEAIATQVRLLSADGVNEVWEGNHPSTRVGSSAMPHKRANPITAENICGLARLARGYAGMLQQGIVQWGDRDLAHSSVERVAIPDLLHVTCTALNRTGEMMVGLVWDTEEMANNVDEALEAGAGSYAKLTQVGGDYMANHAKISEELSDR